MYMQIEQKMRVLQTDLQKWVIYKLTLLQD